MANHTMDQSSASPSPEAPIARMARAMLASSADRFSGCHTESFIKGFEKGFDAGWAFGFEQAIAEGKREAEEELRERAKKAKADTMCLLSDAALGANSWDSASIKSEDVFYDSRSGESDAEDEDEDQDVFYDASPFRAASEDGDSEPDEASTPAASNMDDSPIPIITLTLSDEEDLLDLFYDADQLAGTTATAASSPESACSDITTTRKPESLPATNMSCINEAAMTDVFLSSSPAADEKPTGPLPFTTPRVPPVHLRSPPSNPTPTPAPRNTTTQPTTAATSTSTTTSSPRIPALTSPILPAHHPRNLPLTFPSLANLTAAHTIPLPHTIHPATPDFTATHGPRPPYPRLAGAFNIYRPGLKKVVENPWRVLIGPLSKEAREEWRGDGGKKWVREKLGEGADGGGYSRGWGRGGRGGWNGRGYGRVGGDGVALCEMVRYDEEVWYLLVLFESPERARRAEERFGGYPCGGSIMWAWLYREEE